jgi:hypothetical protein
MLLFLFIHYFSHCQRAFNLQIDDRTTLFHYLDIIPAIPGGSQGLLATCLHFFILRDFPGTVAARRVTNL